MAQARNCRVVCRWVPQAASRLQRAKRYPRGAEKRREQGVVTLRFSLGSDGDVLERSIARSSGNAELDQEVLAMVRRAQPFPSFPPQHNADPDQSDGAGALLAAVIDVIGPWRAKSSLKRSSCRVN